MASSLVGRKLGSYKIVELLGQGGMATVYKGYRDDIDRYVAIKVLPPHPGLDQQFIDRFKLEAKTIAKLQHPHILPLYDYGVEDDILYLIMAYIEGGSLSERIERGGLQLKEIDKLLRQIAGALDYAHRQGVIHRDIKPDNILLDKEGHALLADFGIAKLVGGGDSRLTATGGLVGTPAYISPEQGRGDAITPSVDIYSLGVVVWEMVTGKQPYSADTPMQVVIKHMSAPVPSVRDFNEDLPAALEVVLQRAMAKTPQNRYATASEFAEDFTRAVHTSDSLVGMKVDYQPSLDPTVDSAQLPATPTITPGTGTTQPTIVLQQSGMSPLVLLGGFAIIAALIVALVFLLLNNQNNSTAVVTVPTEVVSQPTATIESATAAPTAPPVPTFGRLSYSSTNKPGDTATLQVQNLRPPSDGNLYVVWLLNTVDGSAQDVGALTLDALGSGVLAPYTDPRGRTLPALFNAVVVTEETEAGDAPTGEAVYSASLPTELLDALRQIFVTSEDGLPASATASYDADESITGGPPGGLLFSALAEADIARQHAGLAQMSTNAGALHTHNEHTINILAGTETDYNANGRGENPGFKQGVSRFVDLMEVQIDAAANAPGSTRRLQGDLELIRVCLANTRQRIDIITALEEEMLAADDPAAVEAQAAESTGIAVAMIDGVDTNGNGQVEPFEQECGLKQIETYGLLVGVLDLLEGALPG